MGPWFGDSNLGWTQARKFRTAWWRRLFNPKRMKSLTGRTSVCFLPFSRSEEFTRWVRCLGIQWSIHKFSTDIWHYPMVSCSDTLLPTRRWEGLWGVGSSCRAWKVAQYRGRAQSAIHSGNHQRGRNTSNRGNRILTTLRIGRFSVFMPHFGWLLRIAHLKTSLTRELTYQRAPPWYLTVIPCIITRNAILIRERIPFFRPIESCAHNDLR